MIKVITQIDGPNGPEPQTTYIEADNFGDMYHLGFRFYGDDAPKRRDFGIAVFLTDAEHDQNDEDAKNDDIRDD